LGHKNKFLKGRSEEIDRLKNITMKDQTPPKMVDVPKIVFDNPSQDDDTISARSNMVEDSSDSSNGVVIGAEESKRVKISRIIMFLILGGAATGFGLLTWFYTSGQEEKNFESTVSIDPVPTLSSSYCQ
jgi:hypothetical protein